IIPFAPKIDFSQALKSNSPKITSYIINSYINSCSSGGSIYINSASAKNWVTLYIIVFYSIFMNNHRIYRSKNGNSVAVAIYRIVSYFSVNITTHKVRNGNSSGLLQCRITDNCILD